ncbi:MAG TPA: fructosamine kinase family protein [Rhodocyclaceae bacterium]|nr:fructosamine kinase family protein [Rhodocyclaceae bacterium]
MNIDTALPAIEAALRATLGNAFRATRAEPVGGGCIHRAFTLTAADGARYFVKLNDAAKLAMFEAEADGLAAIAATGTFRTPAVLTFGGDAVRAYLVLEHLVLRPVQSAEDGARFAAALVAMHHARGERYGWHRDNFIGATPQSNLAEANWAQFFVRHRLQPQFALARRSGFGGTLQRQAGQLMARVPALFLDYRPQPALLHGDLWHGNAGIGAAGEPVLYDPACHYGDREADLAMSELFGGFPGSFYARYRRGWPLDTGYEARKPLYCLYHILNHLNLFGRGYLREAERLTMRLNEALSLRRD